MSFLCQRNLGSFRCPSTGFAWGRVGAGVNTEAEAAVEISVSGGGLQRPHLELPRRKVPSGKADEANVPQTFLWLLDVAPRPPHFLHVGHESAGKCVG